jgi:hypothetical protein
MRALGLVAALAIVAGCAPVRTLVYGPTPTTRPADAPGQIDGHDAEKHPVPAGDPRGDVQIAVVRLTSVIEPDVPDGRRIPVVVVRMIVHNRDDQVWCVESGALDAVVESRHEYPVRAFGDGQPLWSVVVRPGETRSVDLYYELSEPTAKPSVAVNWRVNTPKGPLATSMR